MQLKLFLVFFYSIFFVLAIILTGERSNAIKAVSGLFLFYLFNDSFKLKEKIFSIFIIILTFIFVINKSVYLEHRYNDFFFKPVILILQTNKEFNKKDKLRNKVYIDKLKNNIYFDLYQSGFEVFKKYPIMIK